MFSSVRMGWQHIDHRLDADRLDIAQAELAPQFADLEQQDVALRPGVARLELARLVFRFCGGADLEMALESLDFLLDAHRLGIDIVGRRLAGMDDRRAALQRHNAEQGKERGQRLPGFHRVSSSHFSRVS